MDLIWILAIDITDNINLRFNTLNMIYGVYSILKSITKKVLTFFFLIHKDFVVDIYAHAFPSTIKSTKDTTLRKECY